MGNDQRKPKIHNDSALDKFNYETGTVNLDLSPICLNQNFNKFENNFPLDTVHDVIDKITKSAD